jgi:Domain of unknown function (DUF222)/HNH endonuclease
MFALSDERPTLEELAERRREIDRLEAAWLRDVARYDRSHDWAADGFVNAGSALREACRMTPGNASASVHLARKLEQLPATAAAFGRGEISRQHAMAIADAYTPERASALEQIEAQLVDVARLTHPRNLRAVVRHYADALDGDGGAASDEAQHARRRLPMSSTMDDAVIGEFRFYGADGEIVLTAVKAEEERDRVPNDTRSPAQRRADAFVNLCRRDLDNGNCGSSRKVRPHVTIVDDLARYADTKPELVADARAEAANIGHLSRATLERLTCDCVVSRVVIDGPSQIIDVGRATRTIPPALWKALVVRDRHCQAPGCDRPPGWCEGHHIWHWEHGGPTNLDNLVLLCWHHHRAQHAADAVRRE